MLLFVFENIKLCKLLIWVTTFLVCLEVVMYYKMFTCWRHDVTYNHAGTCSLDICVASKQQSGFIVGSLTQEGLDMSPNHIYCLFTTEIIDSFTLLDLILSNFANMPYKVSSMFAPTIS